jgi:hypothetical protein
MNTREEFLKALRSCAYRTLDQNDWLFITVGNDTGKVQTPHVFHRNTVNGPFFELSLYLWDDPKYPPTAEVYLTGSFLRRIHLSSIKDFEQLVKEINEMAATDFLGGWKE